MWGMPEWGIASIRRMLMTSASKPMSSRNKVREHRARLRSRGLRPVEIWVPDVHAPTFQTEAHRQFLAVSRSVRAGEDQAIIDAVSDRGDE
jgi:Protein  of unknown function (DUF3018)